MKQDIGEQPSYWREAYGVAGVEYQIEKSKFVRIDKCWLRYLLVIIFLRTISLLPLG